MRRNDASKIRQEFQKNRKIKCYDHVTLNSIMLRYRNIKHKATFNDGDM